MKEIVGINTCKSFMEYAKLNENMKLFSEGNMNIYIYIYIC